MKKVIFLCFLVSALSGCGPRDFEPPENVKMVLEIAGENEKSLQDVIDHYKKNREVIKEEAAYFLIGNMLNHSYIKYALSSEDGKKIPFDILDFPEYESLLDGWDSLKKEYGEIIFDKTKIVHDYDVIQSDYLINNIDLAYQVWNKNNWCSHVNFDQFCEYVLPYRVTNEPLEVWREYFQKELRWVKDSVKNHNDPVEAVSLVNNYIMSWFRFDPRYYKHPTDQGLKEMVNNKLGRCEDMTNLAIYAMRSIGLPVMSDFTPYWANTGNNHAWNAVLADHDSILIFMGGESNPGHYKLHNKLAKVYRKTFAVQQNSLAGKARNGQQLPPYLDRNNIIDVTHEYTPVTNLRIKVTGEIPDSTEFAYICVFNSGKWKAIDYSKLKGKKAHFTKMGNGIVYLPAFYSDKEIIPAHPVFMLNDDGSTTDLIPDYSRKQNLIINATTVRAQAASSETVSLDKLKSGTNYTLFIWDDNWINLGKQNCSDTALIYNNAPSNGLFWLVEENSRKEERVFTLDGNGKIKWW
ncbi:MAG: transglutaminase-like domain-containing protein [Bacteroidales bacterium]|nr:transglutaminase-like domain-containing protein [Bacteroidales bacterium]